ncbi:MAG: Asp-tRNA(Asn)/Glu-tRNA(Gln) amidotransferase subunit GatC [Eubacteriaceae bacterium]|jgi:aspartyl-tRNA(Asn)/glutamyl-tRNA(Gln) amidotransferase subunit C|nr:Asp-tRNA(Asn)/Glu-tRNA(Gln) amidotransferase subunit GatC [Eubacteriaceae bacterium]
MSISKEQASYIAELTRLELKENEIEGFVADLDKIINYVDTINQLDTTDVETTEHILDLKNVTREDVVAPSLSIEEVLKNAPEQEMNCFKVPRVLE